jgi:hypothetical protein
MNQAGWVPSSGRRAESDGSRAKLGFNTSLRVANLDRSGIFLIPIFYFALTALTREVTLNDTYYYISSILNYSGGRDLLFWDFGHLLWRPGILALFRVSHGIVSWIDPYSLVFRLMLAVNWLAGLGCVLIMARVTRRFASASLTVVVVATLAISQGFLNFVHTGTAYIPGLFFLILALDIATARLDLAAISWAKSSSFGAALALAVLLWLPYIFALPALLLLPVLLGGQTRGSIRFSLKATAACALVGLGTYGCVAFKLNLSTVQEILDWIGASSHSLNAVGGLPRAIYGFGRSWFAMGNDGLQFRRFLLHDPYAPVSPVALLFTSLWKLIFTYSLLAAIIVRLQRGSTGDRRVLAFFLLAVLPVFAFGLRWYGGDMERYLASFPAILVAAACAFNSRPPRLLKLAGIGFVSALLIVNLSKDLRWVREAEDRGLSARLNALGQSPENSYVVLIPGDPLLGIQSSNLTSTTRPSTNFVLISVVPIGYSYANEWRELLASISLKAWQGGKEVWICRGLLETTPQSKWGWVEGADPDVQWKDIYQFFSQFEVSGNRGDFVEILPTPSNIELFKTMPLPANGP